MQAAAKLGVTRRRDGATRRRRGATATALGLAAALTVSAGLVATTGAAAAAGPPATAGTTGTTGAAGRARTGTPVSQATGRFLSGSAAGTSFDTVAALNGERATYPDNPGPNQNDLSGSVLGQTLTSPLGNASVPFPGGVTFGAVGQYARAASDGSARGASGLVGSNGAINVGGSGNGDLATFDLSKLPMADQLTNLLGNLTLTIGAVSARADQAAFGKTLADPSKECTGGRYSRVSDADQAGRYQFANLELTATSPLLERFGAQLKTALGTVLGQLADVPGVGKLPSAADLVGDLSYRDGGVSASLADGRFSIDFAKVLQAAGLDLNNLCPNTSLLPYLGKALAGLPDTLAQLSMAPIKKIMAALPAGLPTDALATLLTTLKDSFETLAGNFSDPLGQALTALSDQLLNIVVNAQDESGATFTQTAVRLELIPDGGSIGGLPGLPSTTPSGLPSGNGVTGAITSLIETVENSTGRPSSGTRSGTSGSGTPKSGTSGSGTQSGGGVLPKLPGIGSNFTAPLAATAAGDPVLELNLASASVTNERPAGGSSSSPSNGVDAESAALPTGVPAGKGQAVRAGDDVPTPLAILALLAFVIAGGGALARRARGQRLI